MALKQALLGHGLASAFTPLTTVLAAVSVVFVALSVTTYGISVPALAEQQALLPAETEGSSSNHPARLAGPLTQAVMKAEAQEEAADSSMSADPANGSTTFDPGALLGAELLNSSSGVPFSFDVNTFPMMMGALNTQGLGVDPGTVQNPLESTGAGSSSVPNPGVSGSSPETPAVPPTGPSVDPTPSVPEPEPEPEPEEPEADRLAREALAEYYAVLPGAMATAVSDYNAFPTQASSLSREERQAYADQVERHYAAIIGPDNLISIRMNELHPSSYYQTKYGQMSAACSCINRIYLGLEEAWRINLGYGDPTGHEAEYLAPLASIGAEVQEFERLYPGASL